MSVLAVVIDVELDQVADATTVLRVPDVELNHTCPS